MPCSTVGRSGRDASGDPIFAPIALMRQLIDPAGRVGMETKVIPDPATEVESGLGDRDQLDQEHAVVAGVERAVLVDDLEGGAIFEFVAPDIAARGRAHQWIARDQLG